VKTSIRVSMILFVLSILILPVGVSAQHAANVDKQLTPANIAKLDAGETILLDQTYTDKDGKTRGKGLAMVIVNAPEAQVWKYLPAFDTYTEFMPRMIGSKIYSNEGSKIGVQYELKIAIKKVKYHCMHDVHPDKGYLEWNLDASQKNDIADTTGYWVTKKHGEGKTIIAYSVSVDTGIAVPKMIQDYLTKKDLPNVVKAVKKRIESGGTYKK
jgi:carbon monoxide dehydrogenase subunit G